MRYRPSHDSGFKRVVSLWSWNWSVQLPEASVAMRPNAWRVSTCCPLRTDTADKLQYTDK